MMELSAKTANSQLFEKNDPLGINSATSTPQNGQTQSDNSWIVWPICETDA